MGKYNDLFVTLLEKGLIDRKTCYKYFSQNFKKYTIEDFNSFKKDENGRIICPSGDYSEIKNFPDFCKFEKECFLPGKPYLENHVVLVPIVYLELVVNSEIAIYFMKHVFLTKIVYLENIVCFIKKVSLVLTRN